MKRKSSLNVVLTVKNDQCTMHIPLPMQKKEEFQVIFNYNIGKSSPTKMVKKERIWVLISLMDIL